MQHGLEFGNGSGGPVFALVGPRRHIMHHRKLAMRQTMHPLGRGDGGIVVLVKKLGPAKKVRVSAFEGSRSAAFAYSVSAA